MDVQALVQFAFMRWPLAALLGACADASLDVIVLKGAALAETVYDSPALRPFGDIDVLVRPEDALRAHGLLSALGYVCDDHAWAGFRAGRSCEANFFQHNAQGPVVVELHTSLLNNPLLSRAVHVDTDGLWRRALSACLAGQNARVLGPEDQIFHLCLHLAGHYFAAPKSIQDIAQVCAARTVDWPLFVSVCRAARAETAGYAGLFAAMTVYGIEIPPIVINSLAPRFHRRLLEQLVAGQAARDAAPEPEHRRFLLLWLLLGHAGARFFAVRHLFFPARAWLHAHYYHDLPDVSPRRLPVGILLYGQHLRFLAAAVWKRGRK